MAIQRIWVTCTPAGRTLVQEAIDEQELDWEVTPESWQAYPSPENPRVYWVGWQGEEAMRTTLETLIASVVNILGALVARVRRGPVRFRDPQMTRAQAEAGFPLPNIGPPSSTIMSLNAALWLHYRDFLLGPYDDIGLPNVVAGPIDVLTARFEAPAVAEEEPPATEPAPAPKGRKKKTPKAEPTE
jgi:hypothetical protein